MEATLQPQPCDGCVLCCKVMGIDEISKPPNEWCPMCDKGAGCKSYDNRPQGCRDFSCAYAMGLMGSVEAIRPDNSKVVMSFTIDGKYPVAYVDKSYPDAWQSGVVGRWFKHMVERLGRGFVVIGDRRFAIGTTEGDVNELRELARKIH